MSAGSRGGNLRLTDAERVEQKRIAKRAGVSWSAWARDALQDAVKRQAHFSEPLARTLGRSIRSREIDRLAKLLATPTTRSAKK